MSSFVCNVNSSPHCEQLNSFLLKGLSWPEGFPFGGGITMTLLGRLGVGGSGSNSCGVSFSESLPKIDFLRSEILDFLLMILALLSLVLANASESELLPLSLETDNDLVDALRFGAS